MRSIYTYDIQFIAFFINTYNMCMQVVECCGKNPHLQVAIPHLWRLHLIPADYTLCLRPEDCVENRIIPRVSGAIPRV
ncbi:MAG: hypothetical protein EGP63_08980 [Bacteroides stercoris]|nr:hypothetical protein [Bacteroides stercoris]